MDRRRYVPSPEGLEVRTMLSTSTAGSPLAFLGGSSTTTQTLPITFQQKAQRIQKIPDNLRALEPNRYLPKDVIQQIQLGMYQVMGRMTPPPSTALTNYNLALRKIVFNSSLSPATPQLLNQRLPQECSSRRTRRTRAHHPDDGREPARHPGRHGQRQPDVPRHQRQRLPPAAGDSPRPADAAAAGTDDLQGLGRHRSARA